MCISAERLLYRSLPNLGAQQKPQLIVPPNAWQNSVPVDGWVLVGCTVSPGFEFKRFELAPEGWEPDVGLQDADQIF